MAGNDDQHTWSNGMLEFVVLAIGDIDPPLRFQPGNNLTGFILGRRHTNPCDTQYIAQIVYDCQDTGAVQPRRLCAPQPAAPKCPA